MSRKSSAACSSFRHGNIVGRSFDWYYTNASAVVIKTEAAEGVYANYAVIDGLPVLTDAMIDSGKYDELYRHLSSTALDGFNEKGLVINDNVVPVGDIDTPSRYIKNNSICSLALCRYILDKAANVDEAVAILERMNIWFDKDAHDADILLHWHIHDKSGKSVIAEMINGEIKVVEGYVMTNYYNTIPMTPHSNGIERYNILTAGLDSVTDVASGIELIKKVRYTNAYNLDQDPFWYSEMNANIEGYSDLTIDSKPEDYKPVIDVMQEMFKNRSRETGDTWYSAHATVYDLENNTMTILVQEEDTEYTFSL